MTVGDIKNLPPDGEIRYYHFFLISSAPVMYTTPGGHWMHRPENFTLTGCMDKGSTTRVYGKKLRGGLFGSVST